MPAATIKDVALRAGLSVTTVSRALNKSGYVSAKARQRIADAVAQLSYQPNWMARGLKGKPSRSIGLIIPDISNLFYTAVAKSVSDALSAVGYDLILCVNNEDASTDLGHLRVLYEKRADGIIYVHPSQGSNSTFVHQLVGWGMPIVELVRQRETGLLDAVLGDDFRGAYDMTKYLVDMGHRRIGFLIGETHLTTGRNSLSGHRRALQDAGIPVNPDLVRIGTFTRLHGEQGTHDLLKLADPPTAIFAGSNRLLFGALFALRERGMRVPDDVSVVAFDDAEWLSIWNPPITTVDLAEDEMAHVAVGLLQRRIASLGQNHKPTTCVVSTVVVERDSCSRLR